MQGIRWGVSLETCASQALTLHAGLQNCELGTPSVARSSAEAARERAGEELRLDSSQRRGPEAWKKNCEPFLLRMDERSSKSAQRSSTWLSALWIPPKNNRPLSQLWPLFLTGFRRSISGMLRIRQDLREQATSTLRCRCATSAGCEEAEKGLSLLCILGSMVLFWIWFYTHNLIVSIIDKILIIRFIWFWYLILRIWSIWSDLRLIEFNNSS